MKKLITAFVLMVFCLSPAVFGANLDAATIYKQAYIDLNTGKDPVQVVNSFIASIRNNQLTVKEVLDAALAKGYLSQDQVNTVLDTAQKYAYLANDPNFAARAKAGAFSKEDIATVAQALEGKIGGATYWACDRRGDDCWWVEPHRHYRVYHADSALAIIVVGCVIGVVAAGLIIATTPAS